MAPVGFLVFCVVPFISDNEPKTPRCQFRRPGGEYVPRADHQVGVRRGEGGARVLHDVGPSPREPPGRLPLPVVDHGRGGDHEGRAKQPGILPNGDKYLRGLSHAGGVREQGAVAICLQPIDAFPLVGTEHRGRGDDARASRCGVVSARGLTHDHPRTLTTPAADRLCLRGD